MFRCILAQRQNAQGCLISRATTISASSLQVLFSPAQRLAITFALGKKKAAAAELPRGPTPARVQSTLHCGTVSLFVQLKITSQSPVLSSTLSLKIKRNVTSVYDGLIILVGIQASFGIVCYGGKNKDLLFLPEVVL